MLCGRRCVERHDAAAEHSHPFAGLQDPFTEANDGRRVVLLEALAVDLGEEFALPWGRIFERSCRIFEIRRDRELGPLRVDDRPTGAVVDGERHGFDLVRDASFDVSFFEGPERLIDHDLVGGAAPPRQRRHELALVEHQLADDTADGAVRECSALDLLRLTYPPRDASRDPFPVERDEHAYEHHAEHRQVERSYAKVEVAHIAPRTKCETNQEGEESWDG